MVDKGVNKGVNKGVSKVAHQLVNKGSADSSISQQKHQPSAPKSISPVAPYPPLNALVNVNNVDYENCR